MDKKVKLEAKNISKSFGGTKANNSISLKFYENEIVALVGDNGAGKSTFIKIISGVHKKDNGEIYIDGERANINKPSDSIKYGIETVYQDESLIPILDATSNLFLGREKLKDNILGKLFKFIDKKYMVEKTIETLKKLGIVIKDINSEIVELSGGQRQSIVVGRAVFWGGNILIFDEPTNNLGVKQEKIIIDLIKKIREEYNVSIIIITHNIAHVFELVDRIIVLRNGEVVGDKLKEETNPNEIVSMITGLKN